jgi:two-component system invasion response regulator UvrY
MKAMKTPNIMIVDDHAIVRDGLRQILLAGYPGSNVISEADGVSALARFGEERWDVVLLDISLPGENGFELLKKIKSVAPEAKVIILTMHPEEQYGVKAIREGASGFITKNFAAEQVFEAVRTVLAGGHFISSELAERLAVSLRNKNPGLSQREKEVLCGLVSGKPLKEIGHDLSLSIKTVSTYRTRLMLKLGLTTTAELITHGIREGLMVERLPEG